MGMESPPVNKAITGERARMLLLMILILATYLFLAYGAYSLFTSQIPSGNDFYSRWRGTRAFLYGRTGPYSEEVTSGEILSSVCLPLKRNQLMLAITTGGQKSVLDRSRLLDRWRTGFLRPSVQEMIQERAP